MVASHFPRLASSLATQKLICEYGDQAARLRYLAASVTAARIRARLLDEAANQDELAREAKRGRFQAI
jgi:hypothetical protein